MESKPLRQRVTLKRGSSSWHWSEANLLHHHIVSIRKGNTNHHNATAKPVFKIDSFTAACQTTRVSNAL
jgi:hypothetical protein